MQSVYRILFKINFNHSYFTDGVFNAVGVSFTDAAKKTIDNLGLIVKPFKGGFYILYDENFAGSIRKREDLLTGDVTLPFTLTLNDPLFYNYTADVPAQFSQSIYYFSNTQKPDNGRLHTGDYVSAQDVYALADIKQQFFVKPFARLDVELHADAVTDYTINFKARSTYWRYILMSDHLQDLTSPAIIDADSSSTFSEILDINLPDNKAAKAFTSGSELQLSQRPLKTFQLAENYQKGSSKYKVVIRALPQPNITAISSIPNNNSTNFSDIFIY